MDAERTRISQIQRAVVVLCHDFRDAGACRYRWEDNILEYFGADLEDGEESAFDKFAFCTNGQFR